MNPLQSVVQFLKEAYYELRKSSWLSRREAADSTKVVVLIVALMSLYVAGIDFVLSVILGAVLGR
jgi:preprotein translocase SecE subunit